MLILFLILIVLALVILIANIAIVPQAYSYVVERLGVYYTIPHGRQASISKRRLSRASQKKSPSRSRSWTLSPSL